MIREPYVVYLKPRMLLDVAMRDRVSLEREVSLHNMEPNIAEARLNIHINICINITWRYQ